MQCHYKKRERNWLPIWSGWWSYHVGDYKRGKREYCNAVSMPVCTDGKEQYSVICRVNPWNQK